MLRSYHIRRKEGRDSRGAYARAVFVLCHRRWFDENASKAWSAAAEWHGLEIISTEKGGPKDKEGIVEFRALYTANGEFCNHHEVSKFVRQGKEWKFADGELVGETPTVREEPKIGRNDPCPCGSGKKYKKCCGKDK